MPSPPTTLIYSIDMLRACPFRPMHEQLVFVEYGTVAGDGRGGWFRYLRTSPLIDDDETLIVPNGSHGDAGTVKGIWYKVSANGWHDGLIATWPKLEPDVDGITNMAERSIGHTHVDTTVTCVAFVPDDVLIANDDDAAELTVYKRDSAGLNWVSVAHALTFTVPTGGTGNWVKFAPVHFTIDCAAVEAGSSLTFEINKIISIANLGVVVPSGVIVVTAAKTLL